MNRRALTVASLLCGVLALSACGGAVDAGTRVSPPPSTSVAVAPASPAPPELVAAADLADCPATEADAAPVENGLPDLVLPCLGDGPAVHLSGLRGRPTVVNLWASWCAPCRDELPLFADLAAGTREVRVLGVDVEDDPSSALQLLQATGVHYASARDDARLTQGPLRWGGLPMTLFVDADGVVTHEERAPITSAEQLDRLVQTHLGVTVSS